MMLPTYFDVAAELARRQWAYALEPLTRICPSCGALCDKHDRRPDGRLAYHCRNEHCAHPWCFVAPTTGPR